MAYVPDELRLYHPFHEALNNFTWLLKARWTAREELQRKRFRLDQLFQGYAEQQIRDLQRVRRGLLDPNHTPNIAAAEASLCKVWFNELAFATPQLPDPLILDSRGVTANFDASAQRLTFAPWPITKAYYTVYHALQTLLALRGTQYRREQHEATHRAFKGQTLGPLRASLVGFPFDLTGTPAGVAAWTLTDLPAHAQYLKHKYASHPRYRTWYGADQGQSFEATATAVVDHFSTEARKQGAGVRYMLPDLLRDLRVWANYVEIDSFVALRASGFRAYLDQDLHTITFFYSGMAEVGALGVLGAARTVQLARKFYKDFITANETLWRSPAAHALDVRFQLYRHLGWLERRRWAVPAPPPTTSLPRFRPLSPKK